MASRVRTIHHPEGYLGIQRVVVNVGEAITNQVTSDARAMAPVETGKLRASIRNTRVTTYSWHVLVGTDHWHQMEYGVKPHGPILPKLKKALWWGGLPHPISHVKMHPGNKAKPFMRPAVMQPRAFVVLSSGTVVVSSLAK